jgi:hypothetical protein
MDIPADRAAEPQRPGIGYRSHFGVHAPTRGTAGASPSRAARRGKRSRLVLVTLAQEWWLLGGDRKPVGPMTTDLLIERIVGGDVSRDALVCVVGGSEWQALADVPAFSTAVGAMNLPSNSESGIAPARLRRRSGKLLELEERTLVDGIPLWPAEPAPESQRVTGTLRQEFTSVEDAEERTLVDSPFHPSDPSE